jgi:hypothetical protein
VELDPRLRPVLAAVADVLIPAGDGMPSASQAGVPDRVEQVLGYRPDLAGDFIEAVRWCCNREPETALDELAARRPMQFKALTLVTSGAYVLSPQAVQALALDEPPLAVTDDTETYIHLLADVVERGFEIR